MIESSVSKGITIASEPDDDIGNKETSFPAAIEAISEAILEKSPNKSTNLSGKNIKGLIRIDVLNDFMIKHYQHEITPLTKLSEKKVERVYSSSGWGTTKFIEAIKGIQATFEQTEIPSRLRNMLGR